MTIAERTAPQGFHDLDELVLQLKGLVLVRDLRRQRDAHVAELEMYDHEIRRVRDLLADLVRTGRKHSDRLGSGENRGDPLLRGPHERASGLG